jgi:hypothetical protein
MRASPVAWLLRTVIWKIANIRIKDDLDSPMAREMRDFLKYMPLRMMVMFGSGISLDMLEGLLLMINGKLLQGMRLLWRALQENRRRAV